MIKKIIIAVTILVMGVASVNTSAMAANPWTVFGDEETTSSDNSVSANILTGCTGDDGIQCILNLVVEIMSIGVGVLGVIGITVVGIQYLTAGGNEEQTRKAKRRLFEIVLGLVAYVIIYAILRWLLPTFGN